MNNNADDKINVVLKPMALSDVPELVELEKLCFDESWTVESYENEIKNTRSACYLVCRHQGIMIGYVGAWLILDEAHITNVALHPQWRGRGLGKFLVWHIIKKALDKKCRWATLEVSEKNTPAINLYKGFSFKEIGRRKSYYASGEDALVMWAGKIQHPPYEELMKKFEEEWNRKICLSWE